MNELSQEAHEWLEAIGYFVPHFGTTEGKQEWVMKGSMRLGSKDMPWEMTAMDWLSLEQACAEVKAYLWRLNEKPPQP